LNATLRSRDKTPEGVMSDRLSFNTDVLPERDRFPAFCEEFVRRYTGLDIIAENRVNFQAAIEVERAGPVFIARLSTTPAVFARGQQHIRDGDDGLCIILMERGAGYQTQSEQGQKLATGDAVSCDCSYPGDVNFTSSARIWDLKIPRHKITPLASNLGHFAGVRLDKDPIARRLLFGYLNAAQNIDLAGDGTATRLYEDHIIDLVALALGAEGEAREFVERRSLRTVRRAAILREIESSMGNPELDAQIVAARLGITARWLHVLLEDTGRTFSEHLVEQRLDRAAALLRNPQHGSSRIADIAFRVGFADLSHFNRAFRRKFGVTPTDLREAALKSQR
jgi:AraC-like DNA-binding protein